jgi:hypothetical protein
MAILVAMRSNRATGAFFLDEQESGRATVSLHDNGEVEVFLDGPPHESQRRVYPRIADFYDAHFD